ncbi:hypothetical protein M3Y94_00581400 [Aphelenchoides besseyi]|nr:hypothetical protein M3Y94_00581400 [Aphelenchoides besseyi]KAI6222031.1 hypothetical protein M3Y95_00941400 [Aphelenchoides besseyi]
MSDRFHKLSQRLRSRINEMFSSNSEGLDEHLVTIPTNGESSTGQTDYTELGNGSVPCPSCNGSGMIPKELESTLVALIPINDNRLKPRKTWTYISIWVTICLFFGGSILFVLMPRTVTLSSDVKSISVVNVTRNDPSAAAFIDFNFIDRVNVSSGNYLPVSIINITATIVSKFQPWSVDIVGYGQNSSIDGNNQLPVFGKGIREVYFNNSVKLQGYVSEYCQSKIAVLTPLYVTFQFDIAVTLQYYYGHQEQVTLRTNQQVCCVPSGNCTAATR